MDTVVKRDAESRRERMRAMMRDDILAAARRLLAEHGIEGLSMRALGKAVGVSAPTLYEYFPAKEDVLNALYVEGMTRFQQTFEQVAAETKPGVERLRQMAIAYRQFALSNRDLYYLLFARVDASYRPGVDELNECAGSFGIAVREMAQAMESGEVKSGDPITFAFMIWALAHGIVMLELGGIAGACAAKFRGEPIDPETKYVAVIDQFLDGIRT